MKIKFKNYVLMMVLCVAMQSMYAEQDTQPTESEVTQAAVTAEKTKADEVADEYIYDVKVDEQLTESDAIVEPKVISDKTVNNYFNTGKTRTLITQETKNGKIITTTEIWKTKNPSYLTWRNGALVVGVGAAVALTYMGIAELKNIARIYYLKSKLYDDIAYADYQLISDLTANFSYEQLADFIENLKNNAPRSTFGYVEMKDIIRIYKAMEADHKIPVIRNTGNGISGFLDNLCLTAFGRGTYFCKRSNADHEAGHALVMALSDNQVVDPVAFVSVKSTRTSYAMPETRMLWHHNAKREIAKDLAGGVAMAIMSGREKESFKDFSRRQLYGMGWHHIEGSDLYNVYRTAEKEYANQNYWSWSTKSQEERSLEIEKLIEEGYNEAYDILQAHKDKLAKMSDELYLKEILSDTEIYEIAGTEIYEIAGTKKPTTWLFG